MHKGTKYGQLNLIIKMLNLFKHSKGLTLLKEKSLTAVKCVCICSTDI